MQTGMRRTSADFTGRTQVAAAKENGRRFDQSICYDGWSSHVAAGRIDR